MYIYSYNPHSASAKALAQAIGARRIKHEGSRFRPNPNKTIINWGSSELPFNYYRCHIINHPDNVRLATDKARFFQNMYGQNSVPPWTNDRNEALTWSREGKLIVCRTVLNGHSGHGIVIAHTEQELVDAPLYVEYVKKKDEYRVHVMNGQVFDIQKKARVHDNPNPNWEVRNLAGGFIYKREGVTLPDVAKEKAINTVRLLGLDFGAVDLIYNSQRRRYYVLEVNTAPGLEGTTLQRYAAAFREHYV